MLKEKSILNAENYLFSCIAAKSSRAVAFNTYFLLAKAAVFTQGLFHFYNLLIFKYVNFVITTGQAFYCLRLVDCASVHRKSLPTSRRAE